MFRRLSAVMVTLAVLTAVCAPAFSAAGAVQTDRMYGYDFTDPYEMQDFICSYADINDPAVEGYTALEICNYTKHWKCEDGEIRRINSGRCTTSAYQWKNYYSLLSLKKRYVNFKAEIEYCYGSNSRWLAVNFGAENTASLFTESGGGFAAFSEKDGRLNFAACTETDAVNRLSGQNNDGFIRRKLEDFDKNAVHILTLCVENGVASVSVDGCSPLLTALPEAYDGGYIGIISGENSNRVLSFTVTELANEQSGGANTVTFDSETDLERFESYYAEIADSSAAGYTGFSPIDAAEKWTVSGGALKRLNNDTVTASQWKNYMAMLTFKNGTYENFEIKMTFQKGKNSRWLILNFGASSPDGFCLDGGDGGYGIFLTQEGNPTFLGNWPGVKSSGYIEAPKLFYSGQNGIEYDKKGIHTVTLRVCGGLASIYADGYETPWRCLLPENYSGGYVSIVSGANDWTVYDWSVTPIEPDYFRFKSTFGNDMLLQQLTENTVRGFAPAGSEVQLELEREADNTVLFSHTACADADGIWSAVLPPLNGGYESYRITAVCGDKEIALNNIVFGELWVCDGQSNMELPLSVTAEYSEALSAARSGKVRMYTAVSNAMMKNTPTEPAGYWFADSRDELLSCFSAVAYHFAAKLTGQLNVPVGVIDVSVGGTDLFRHIDPKTAADYPEFCAELEKDGYIGTGGVSEIATYYRMNLAPFGGFRAAGIVWYQGENEGLSGHPEVLRQGIPVVAESISRLFAQDGLLPFIAVQLAPYPSYKDDLLVQCNQAISDATDKLSQQTPSVCVAIHDVSTEYNSSTGAIHPITKKPVGERAAVAALGAVYAKRRAYSSARPAVAYYGSEGKLHVRFSNIGCGFFAEGEPNGFILRLSDRSTLSVKPDISGSELLFDAEEVTAVSYAKYELNNDCKLYTQNECGELIAVIPFDIAVDTERAGTGDLDSSGSVNADDLVYMRRELFNCSTDGSYDINADGLVDIRDLILLKKLSAKLQAIK